LADFVAIERRPGRIAFLAQQYIPNDGDYRLLFFGSELVVRYRRNAAGGHLHNYAHGATMHSVPADDLPASAVAAARDIVQASGLTVAGIDMVIDSATGQYYFLEINAQPGWGKLKDDIRAPLARLLTE
jgi:glutathione synthase/RimK-type ligase-like ATP-grasp enzyme